MWAPTPTANPTGGYQYLLVWKVAQVFQFICKSIWKICRGYCIKNCLRGMMRGIIYLSKSVKGQNSKCRQLLWKLNWEVVQQIMGVCGVLNQLANLCFLALKIKMHEMKIREFNGVVKQLSLITLINNSCIFLLIKHF